jgi:large subunit ribosomal protein L17
MRHRAKSRKFGRTSSHRLAMYRNMVTSLLEHGRIETTDAKAKEVRRIAERMITLGKRGTLHARRRALRVIRNRDVAERVFGDLAERFRTRAGGYTRVLKLRTRVGDAAPVSLLELVEAPGGAAEAAAGKGRRAGAKAKGAAEKKAAKEAAGGKGRKAAAGDAGSRKAAGKAGRGKGGDVARKGAAPRKAGRSSKGKGE